MCGSPIARSDPLRLAQGIRHSSVWSRAFARDRAYRFFNTSARCWHLSIAFDESNLRICRKPSRGKFVAWSCVIARQLTCRAADGRNLSFERRTFLSWGEPRRARAGLRVSGRARLRPSRSSRRGVFSGFLFHPLHEFPIAQSDPQRQHATGVDLQFHRAHPPGIDGGSAEGFVIL